MLGLTLDTVKLTDVEFSIYLSSPLNFTVAVLSPEVKSGMWISAFPSLTVPVYVLPSISTVTVPVASFGTLTTITASSPTLTSLLEASIGDSYFGISTTSSKI
jgi:hypothetical protein